MNNKSKKALLKVMAKINTLNLDKDRLTKTVSTCIKLVDLIESGTKNIQINAPTGSGKSMIAFIMGLYSEEYYKDSDEKSCYLITPKKSLQEQYNRDIKSFGLDISLLKGQNSYTCNKDKSRTFQNRPCSKYKSIAEIKENLDCANTCPYLVARDKSVDSNIVVMNNHYLITALVNEHQYFGSRKMLIVDESHNFNKILREMYSVSIDTNNSVASNLIMSVNMAKNFHENIDGELNIVVDQLRDYLTNLNDVYDISEMSNWSDKLESVVEIIGKSISISDSIIENIRKYTLKTDEFDNLGYDDEYFDELRESLTLLINENDLLKRVYSSSKDDHNNLILDSNVGVLKMSLLKIDSIYKKVFSSFESVIFMSATPSISHFEELGIEDAITLKMKCNFSKTTAPVVLLREKMLDMSYRSREANFNQLFVNTIQLCNFHKTDNGLIHSGSYLFQEKFKDYVNQNGNSERFIFCKNTEDIQRGFELLKSERGLILVSPSIIEGIDGKGDIARFQIALKCPFPNTLDRYVEKILKEYRSRYNSLVREQIEQLIGRVQRSPRDFGITYLLDKKFDDFISRNGLNKNSKDKILKINAKLLPKVIEKAKQNFE